jgi:hypothetical protein
VVAPQAPTLPVVHAAQWSPAFETTDGVVSAEVTSLETPAVLVEVLPKATPDRYLTFHQILV